MTLTQPCGNSVEKLRERSDITPPPSSSFQCPGMTLKNKMKTFPGLQSLYYGHCLILYRTGKCISIAICNMIEKSLLTPTPTPSPCLCGISRKLVSECTALPVSQLYVRIGPSPSIMFWVNGAMVR